MKLHNEFTVAAGLERTWEALLDVECVARCLPGASLEPVGEDGLYRGSVRLETGPVNIAYGGTVRLADVDADRHVASFDARAREAHGTGTASALIRNRVEPAQDGTRVTVETDLNVTGRAAQLGRGLMEDLAAKVLGDFARRLERLVREAPPTAAERGARPAERPAPEEVGHDLGWARVRGRGPLVAVGVLAALAVLALVLGRRSRSVAIASRSRP